MLNFLVRSYLFGLLLFSASTGQAQKNIVIDDRLEANSTPINVKMGGQWFGKVWKVRFGEYVVVSSKLGWATTTTKSGFFSPKTESKTTQKFSFVVAGKTADSAHVNAASNMQIQTLREVEIFPGFSWGSDELLQETNNFTAFITTNKAPGETWALLMDATFGQYTAEKYEAFLTNGERRIAIVPTSSAKLGNDPRSFPALGYEFVENGESIAALQYFGGGLLGTNKHVVWLHKEVSEPMKLVLAAAITSIIQVRALHEN
jgi:hypothetical protein